MAKQYLDVETKADHLFFETEKDDHINIHTVRRDEVGEPILEFILRGDGVEVHVNGVNLLSQDEQLELHEAWTRIGWVSSSIKGLLLKNKLMQQVRNGELTIYYCNGAYVVNGEPVTDTGLFIAIGDLDRFRQLQRVRLNSPSQVPVYKLVIAMEVKNAET